MNLEVENIWTLVQGHLSKEMKVPSFQTWIKPSKLIEIYDSRAIIAVKNEFNKNFLKQCYLTKITSAIEKVIGRKFEVEIVVKPNLKLNEFIPSIANLKEADSIVNTKSSSFNEGYFDHTFRHKTNLNPSYTF